MQILTDGVDRVPKGVATAVSVGAYDGIHQGHRTVLSTLSNLAIDRGLAAAVVTFDRHPAAVLRPESAPLLLTDHEQRIDLFTDIGIEYLYLLQFNEQRAATSDREFVADVLVDRMNTKLIVVGSNFHFGKARSGSVDSLREFGTEMGFEVIGLDLFAEDDAVEPVSSTAIRRALAGGDITAAELLASRPPTSSTRLAELGRPRVSTPRGRRCQTGAGCLLPSTSDCGQPFISMPSNRCSKLTSSTSIRISTDRTCVSSSLISCVVNGVLRASTKFLSS
jgi:FAD synthase